MTMKRSGLGLHTSDDSQQRYAEAVRKCTVNASRSTFVRVAMCPMIGSLPGGYVRIVEFSATMIVLRAKDLRRRLSATGSLRRRCEKNPKMVDLRRGLLSPA